MSLISINNGSMNWLCKDSFTSNEVTGACCVPLRAALRQQGHTLTILLCFQFAMDRKTWNKMCPAARAHQTKCPEGPL